MNDERFIDLLNLYIDRELSGPEIREIEEAIAASPERQRIYAQYCKIQRACEHLLTSEAPVVPRPKLDVILAAARSPESAEVLAFPSATPAPEPVVARGGSRAGWGWGALSGMAAAAAAFALYTGTLQTAGHDGGNAALPSAVATAAPAASSGAPIGPDDSAASAVAGNEAVYHTVLVLESGGNGSSPGLRLANPNRSEDPFAWMAQVQFEPIRPVRLDALEFRAAEPMEVRNLPAFSYPYPGLDDTPPLSESAAFQFRR